MSKKRHYKVEDWTYGEFNIKPKKSGMSKIKGDEYHENVGLIISLIITSILIFILTKLA